MNFSINIWKLYIKIKTERNDFSIFYPTSKLDIFRLSGGYLSVIGITFVGYRFLFTNNLKVEHSIICFTMTRHRFMHP